MGVMCVFPFGLMLSGYYQYIHILAHVMFLFWAHYWLYDMYACDEFWSLLKSDEYLKHVGYRP